MSFVAGDGTDTADAGVHNWQWCRLATTADANKVHVWQPWVRSQINGTTRVFWWPDVVALACELLRLHASVHPLAVLTRRETVFLDDLRSL